MTLGELKQIVDAILELTPARRDCEVTIPVSGGECFTGTPCVEVETAGMGFDWDRDKFMLYSELILQDSE